jgi:hypothetical protein
VIDESLSFEPPSSDLFSTIQKMHTRLRVLFYSHPSVINSGNPSRDLREAYLNEIRYGLTIVDGVTLVGAVVMMVLVEIGEDRVKLKVPLSQGWAWTLSIFAVGIGGWLPRLLLGGNRQTSFWTLGTISFRLAASIAYLLFPVLNKSARQFFIWFTALMLVLGGTCGLLSALGAVLSYKIYNVCAYLAALLISQAVLILGHLQWLAMYTNLEAVNTIAKLSEGENTYAPYINHIQDETMVYLTFEQRRKLQNLAMDQIQGAWGTIKRDAFWYHPMHRKKLDTDTGAGLLVAPEQGEEDDENESTRQRNPGLEFEPSTTVLFSPCYCCLDSEFPRSLPKNSPEEVEKLAASLQGSKRDQRRAEFARLPRKNQFGLPEIKSIPEHEDERSNPHELCDICRDICNKSSAINDTRILFVKYSEQGQRYEHYPTAPELEKSAKGCHLCTLIWHTLNREQQIELLRIDAALETELQNKLEEAEKADTARLQMKRRDKIRLKFHKKRCIVLVIERPGAYSATAITGHGGWNSVDDLINGFAARIIPHFGDSRIAQRWLPQRTVSRAISLGIDPATEIHREQAAGIRLSPYLARFAGKNKPYITS